MAEFLDRGEAGRRLAGELDAWRGGGALVVGLPRGGVEVAFEVASLLDLALDVLIVRKLGVPSQPELAMGAIGEHGVVVRDELVLAGAAISPETFERVEARERAQLETREQRYRLGAPRLSLAGGVIIIVDDGVATGSTARAACQVARARGAREVIVAAPVIAAQSIELLASVADQVIAVSAPRDLGAVGQWYQHFEATSDDDVVELLDRARRRRPGSTVNP